MTCPSCTRTAIRLWEVDGQRRSMCAGCIHVFLRDADAKVMADRFRQHLGRQTLPWRL